MSTVAATRPSSPARRRPIGAKLRYEVFKRDGFACSDCGAAAPVAFLLPSHIVSPEAGGSEDITNLVTRCEACHPESVERRTQEERQQLSYLKARQEQLEHLIAWQEERAVDKLRKLWVKLTHVDGSRAPHRGVVRAWVRAHSIEKLTRAMQEVIQRVLVFDKTGQPSPDSYDAALQLVGEICRGGVRRDLDFRQIVGLLGLLRSRFGEDYYNRERALNWFVEAAAAGVSPEALRGMVERSASWASLREQLDLGMGKAPETGASA